LYVNKISFKYPDSELLYQDVRITLHPGEYVGLVGAGGSGKTTLINLIRGRLTPTVGNIKIFGKDPSARDHQILAKTCFLDIDSALPDGSLYSILSLHASSFFFYDKMREKMLMDLFNLDYHQRSQKLSNSERCLFKLVLGLSYHPKLIIIDELSTHIDDEVKPHFYQVMTRLREEDDPTIFICTNDVEDLENRVERTYIIEDKTVRLKAPTNLRQRLEANT
jgi:ABC-2 type transport system ATP-binding protein